MTTAPVSSRKGIGGPKTPEGKARVSLNALRHGLDAHSPQAMQIIAEAVVAEYDSMLEEICRHYEPEDPVEEVLVKRIARCSWRMMITEAMEDAYLKRRSHLLVGASYEKIIKHERLIDVQLHRAIAALTRKRAADEKKIEQNKLNSGLFPCSAHAQANREFVPPNSPIPRASRRMDIRTHQKNLPPLTCVKEPPHP